MKDDAMLPPINQTDPIDIVIPWVDSDDPVWRAKFEEFQPGVASRSNDVGEERYRDWDLLRYWFRGIERFCPWVRTIHFITEGHLPDWLDTTNPKLHIVRHEDYIPEEYLPTFNTHVIENNMHRIEGLSEKFVYFNDDMYVTAPCPQEHFFPRGLPAGIATPSFAWNDDLLTHVSLNASALMNRQFSKRSILRQFPHKWLSPKFGARQVIRALSLLPWKYIGPFHIHHLAAPYIKSTFTDVWAVASQELLETNKSRFRRLSDLNQYVFSYWQLCSGQFSPVSPNAYGRLFKLGEDKADEIHSAVRNGSQVLLCLNDGPVQDLQKSMTDLAAAFEILLPEKCTFEVGA